MPGTSTAWQLSASSESSTRLPVPAASCRACCLHPATCALLPFHPPSGGYESTCIQCLCLLEMLGHAQLTAHLVACLPAIAGARACLCPGSASTSATRMSYASTRTTSGGWQRQPPPAPLPEVGFWEPGLPAEAAATLTAARGTQPRTFSCCIFFQGLAEPPWRLMFPAPRHWLHTTL